MTKIINKILSPLLKQVVIKNGIKLYGRGKKEELKVEYDFSSHSYALKHFKKGVLRHIRTGKVDFQQIYHVKFDEKENRLWTVTLTETPVDNTLVLNHTKGLVEIKFNDSDIIVNLIQKEINNEKE